MSVLKYVLAASACVSVAGCYDLSEYEEAADYGRQVQRGQAVLERSERIDDLSNTAFDAVPVQGSAVFKGNMWLRLYDVTDVMDTDSIVVIGDSEVTIDFGAPAGTAVNGTVDTLREAFPNVLDISRPVEGFIDITDGTVGAGAPNDLGLDYAGDLIIDDNTFLISGTADGKLLGTRTKPNPGQSTVMAFEVEDNDVAVSSTDGNYTARVTFNGEN